MHTGKGRARWYRLRLWDIWNFSRCPRLYRLRLWDIWNSSRYPLKQKIALFFSELIFVSSRLSRSYLEDETQRKTGRKDLSHRHDEIFMKSSRADCATITPSKRRSDSRLSLINIEKQINKKIMSHCNKLRCKVCYIPLFESGDR